MPQGCHLVPGTSIVAYADSVYVTFRLNFHHFDRLELDLHEHTQAWDATFSCPRLKLADMVLI